MIKSILVFTTITFLSCTTDKNGRMTGLINQKNKLEDSLKYYKSAELVFKNKAVEIMRATHDTLQYLPVLDSQFKYSNLAGKSEQLIKTLDFSIDSLLKMK